MNTDVNSRRAPSWVWAVVIGAGLFYVAGQYVASQPQRVQEEVEAKREITVEGKAELTVNPDVAKLTLGVNTGPQATAARALELLTDRFNSVLSAVEKQGIDEDDIKTRNVSLNPVYDYADGRQQLRGFEASESVEVTIRELDTIGEVLTVTVLEGVTQAGNIQFSIDDIDELTEKAQGEAIEDARGRAKELAKQLGVKLGSVKSFSTTGSPQQPLFARAELSELSQGATGDVEVPAGTQDVIVTVQITYDIK